MMAALDFRAFWELPEGCRDYKVTVEEGWGGLLDV